MPEKPKRRKNNKNKRKNKNNRSDNNKSSSSDVKDTSTVGSGSVQSLVSLEENNETSCLPIETESIDLELPIPNNVSCGISNKEDECNLEVLHQDLNNNSESIISTSNPVKNEDTDASTALVSTGDPDYTKEVINDELSAVFTGDPDVLKENIDAKLSVVSVCEPVITKENTDANLSVLSTYDTATTKEHTNTKSSIESDCGHVTKITDNAALTSETYIVESPDHSKKHKSKLNAKVKSKSLDNDEETKIVEITDESDKQCEHENTIEILDSSILVTDVESDIEWEKIEDSALEAQELATGTLSVTTIPLNTPQCELTKSLTPDQEMSLRHYLQTLNLSTNPNINTLEIKTEIEQIINREIRHRLRKKGLADDFIPTRLGVPRILDVIDEEGSSESSLTSRRHSYLSDKKSDNEDLEDDVFEAKPKVSPKKSNLTGKNIKSIGRLVPQKCVLVGAKLKEPELAEARGDWIMQTVEQMKGAEFVYLTDSSSSTSSIHELVEESDNGDETDVSVRIITPTIEVTDTDNLLKNNFILDNKEKMQENIETKITSDNSVCAHEVVKSFIDTSNENRHEIVVSSIDDIKTNLYVKDIENLEIDETTNIPKLNRFQKDNINAKKNSDDYDLEMKVLKCELNDAINNLIKEVCSDSEQNEIHKDYFVRQDSSSSISSSQCTAKYNPTYSSLNDVSNTHDETNDGSLLATETTQELSNNGHVKDVFECVTGQSTHRQSESIHPPALRDICVEKITSLPYGDKILEELASVSERLQKINNIGVKSDRRASKEETNNMPYYPLPDLSSIEKVSLPVQQKDPLPPPVQPRNSSLKKSQDDHWTAMPTKVEPVYICLSPSQKMLMEKTNTIISKDGATQLVDMHKKYVDRRGYNEPKIEGNRIKNEANEDPPIVPFKSQTGSRLLALIRDPAVTSTINSSVNNRHYNTEQARKDYSDSELISKLKNDKGTFSEFTGTFKPIPPPRPKKYSSSYYESDESSDFTDTSLRSFRSEKKVFHYSTGNLSKDIEDDISSIQNMHRYYTNIRDNGIDYNKPRRPSLPKDICDQQMEYIRQKEKEVEAEIKRLEQEKVNVSSHKKGPRAPLISEKETVTQNENFDNFPVLKLRDNALNTQSTERTNKSKLSSLFSSSQEELLRDKMYSEYVSQMAERQERKQHKVIKITNPSQTNNSKSVSKSMSALDVLDSKVNNRIEKEFISKARERWNKLGIADPETEDEREKDKDVYREPKVIERKIKVIEAGQERDVKKLPTHLQEFVSFTAKQKERGSGSSAVWRPGAPTPPPAPLSARSPGAPPPPPPPPVWTPGSAGPSPQAPRKSFRPVHFEETPPARRKFQNSEQNGCTSGSESEGRLRTSHSAPVTGLNTLGGTSNASRLPKAQNPTVTLLQKAREGQIPRGASYLQQERDSARLPRDRPSPPIGDPVHVLRKEYASESEAERSDYERGGVRKMADAHRKVEGIGPTTKEGMPVTLRSEVKDPSRWYKKMYDTIHKSKYDDDYVTIRYKNRKGQPPQRVTNKSQYAYFDPRSGYLSEPEGGLSRLGSSTWSDAYDSDVTSGPRRRTASVQEERRISDASSPYMPSNKYSTLASARASQEVYKNQPGRIENYVPGKSSVVDKEAKQWWDEVMDIFDGWLDDNSPLPPYTTLLARAIQKSQNISSTTSLPQASPKDKKDLTATILSKSNMARALKESGYESDSTLVFRRREEADGPLSPAERRAAYRDLQAGGEPPLRGFRSPAPPRQETDSAPEPPRRTPHGSYSDTESPRRYLESDVNIHYRCPVRHDPLPLVPERELARQQAEHMKKLYREQRRNKYLQELQDMQNRRHQDNFTPSQKNILPLNRYDEADRVVARALYAFNGQTARELSFRKGDLLSVRRQIDSNWYEGEIHGRIGLFPYNYVEIMKGEVAHSPKKPTVIEGRARAKFDFTAQTNLELPLKKGEIVVLTRRIDQNWWEGRNGSKTGIFPDSYVTILQEPSQNKPEVHSLTTDKPVASPAAHGLLNGTAKRSMGAHSYLPQPNNPALSNAPPATQPLPGYVAKPAQATLTPSDRGYGPPTGAGVDLNNSEPLYVDTNAEAVPYRAMYKYRPQNPDELELNEGDTVYVLEKCDDGWYVGSSQRTGRFGTFPGNYVERI